MPFAEFQESNAGERLNRQVIANIDFAQSLMERAQRRRVLEQEVAWKAEQHASNMASSSLAQQQQQRALSLASLELKRKERDESRHNKLIEAFQSGEELEYDIEDTLGILDPVEQRREMGRLFQKFGKYAEVPELRSQIAAAFERVEIDVKTKELSKAHDHYAMGRYGDTRKAAEEKYPGQVIRELEYGGRTIFVPQGIDPDHLTAARKILDAAVLTGDVAKMEAAVADDRVQRVWYAPDSPLAAAYFPRIEAARRQPQPTNDGATGAARVTAILAASDDHDETPHGSTWTGAAVGLGRELGVTGILRGEYDRLAKELDKIPDEKSRSAARDILKAEFRRRQTALGKAITAEILKKRKEAGHVPKTSNATKTNPGVNRAGQMMKHGGRALQVVGSAGEVYNIITTPEQERAAEIARAGGRLGGALLGAKAGAAGGALVGPWGAGIGAVVGGAAGAYGGEALVNKLIGDGEDEAEISEPAAAGQK